MIGYREQRFPYFFSVYSVKITRKLLLSVSTTAVLFHDHLFLIQLNLSSNYTVELIVITTIPFRHELMLKCWNFEAENRPTFKYCLNALTTLHAQTSRNSVTGVHNGQYISTVPQSKCQNCYFPNFSNQPLACKEIVFICL